MLFTIAIPCAQDAVKFVEKQVQSVGTNVKKFYSDVMQDLVSQDSTDCTNVLSSQTTGEVLAQDSIGSYLRALILYIHWFCATLSLSF